MRPAILALASPLILGSLLWSAEIAADHQQSAPAATSQTSATTPESDTDDNAGPSDSDTGENRRNENVQFNLIDNNALKDTLKRLGGTATLINEFRADEEYFGAEVGNPVERLVHIETIPIAAFHGRLHYSHLNSALSARSFFQVGSVKPAREHDFGGGAGLPVWRGGFFSIEGNRSIIRGSVNGNVLIPTAEERIPLTDDPILRPLVERIMAGFPNEAPNRSDINPRMLNTNAPQNTDSSVAGARLEQDLGSRDRLLLRYRYVSQTVEAFQMVAGQNPDSTSRSHEARITWNRVWTPNTLTDFSIAFDRLGSLLVPPGNSLGPMVHTGGNFTVLGPWVDIPIDRAENIYRYGGNIQHTAGKHSLYGGFQIGRRQTNGTEDADHRGVLVFWNDFGYDAVTNLRRGAPTMFAGAYGHIHRGFRRWENRFYAGDTWRATRALTLNVGLALEPITKSVEVNNLNVLPYSSDWNNLAPRFGFAYQLPGSWGVLRGAYGIHYGQIFAVTTGQARYNPPLNTMFQIREPDIRKPIDELLKEGAESGTPPRVTYYPDDLVTPYSHQYNFSWEPVVSRNFNLQMAYIGSRSHKLLSMWFFNRAVPVPGVEQTTGTIQERRADPEIGEIRQVLNGSRSYYDAALIRGTLRSTRGLSFEASYWFSKSMALGTDHNNTANSKDAYENYPSSQYGIHDEMKSLTTFDQPHAMQLRALYELPRFSDGHKWVSRIFRDWNLSGVVLLKTGTPFAVIVGSDAPGFGNVDGSGGDRPHIVDPSILGRSINHPDTSQQQLPKTAFEFMQPTDTRGNLGWNTFRKDGLANVNAALSRVFPITGDRRIEFRAESINFLNTPQFAEPGFTVANQEFGAITNTLNEGRTFRFQLEFQF